MRRNGKDPQRLLVGWMDDMEEEKKNPLEGREARGGHAFLRVRCGGGLAVPAAGSTHITPKGATIHHRFAIANFQQ